MAEEKKFSAEVYYKSGSVEWIVLIHGFGGSARTWKKQVDFFSKYYNLLVLEMHKGEVNTDLDLDKVCERIKNTLNYYQICKAHLLGFSFSSLICLRFAVLYPEKVNSLIMGGGIVRFNLKTRSLLLLAITFKRAINYMILYRFFAYIIMPKRNHKRSRVIFVNEAKKLGYDEFCRWLDIIPQTTNSLTWLDELDGTIKVLYVSGNQDYLFLKDTLKYSKRISNSHVEVIDDCGHVCSIEQYDEFNNIVFKYLDKWYGI
ncbi:MAG: alpha/beta hydrolase [Methanolobus sp.]|uniref:alpha/beta fold hydrolase n=1 Tax=Methanolobus sp. TaxID=1874737 RepID=UPI00272F4244|nr:alpha/beta hydrolase [Methanolobus sp.]MDP2215865.1 alpha/beta hydrolase [Methanolobus sp.]